MLCINFQVLNVNKQRPDNLTLTILTFKKTFNDISILICKEAKLLDCVIELQIRFQIQSLCDNEYSFSNEVQQELFQI